MEKILCDKCKKEVEKTDSRKWKGKRICNDCFNSKEIKEQRKLKKLATGY